MESLSVPPDVRLARTVRALRDAVVGCGAACLGLAVIAAAILALSGSDPLLAGPTLTILGGGQLLALVGAALAALGLHGALAGHPLGGVVGTTRARMRWVVRAALVWSVGAAVGWALADPARTLLFLALGAVTAQLAVLVLVLRRRLPREG